MRTIVILCWAARVSTSFQFHAHWGRSRIQQQRATTSLNVLAALNETSTQGTAPLSDLPQIPIGRLITLASQANSYESAIRSAVLAEELYLEDDLPGVLSIWSAVAYKLQEWHKPRGIVTTDSDEGTPPELDGVDLSQVQVYTARDVALHAESLLSDSTDSDAIRATMECWKHSRDEAAPQHVEDLMNRDESENGFHLLLDTYANAKNVVNRVEVMEKMLSEKDMTTRSSNPLLFVYSKMQGKADDATRILNELKERYEQTMDPVYRPDILTYSHGMLDDDSWALRLNCFLFSRSDGMSSNGGNDRSR